MAQSGLRPHTIKQLKLKNLEDFNRIPCKIEVPQEMAKGKFGSYVTFIGFYATKYLKQYLATRPNLTLNSLLFCSHSDPASPVDVYDMSRAFQNGSKKERALCVGAQIDQRLLRFCFVVFGKSCFGYGKVLSSRRS